MDRRLSNAWSVLFGDERGFWKKQPSCELIVDDETETTILTLIDIDENEIRPFLSFSPPLTMH